VFVCESGLFGGSSEGGGVKRIAYCVKREAGSGQWAVGSG